jgi:predicted exporter
LNKIGVLVYLLAIVCAVIVITIRFSNGVPLETNLLALLPDSESEDWVQQAQKIQQSQGSEKIILLVGHEKFGIAREAAVLVESILVEEEILEKKPDHAGDLAASELGKKLFLYRAGLLAPQDRQAIKAGEGEKLADRARAQIFSPLAFSTSDNIRKDPFLLFPAFLSSLQETGPNFYVREGVLTTENDGRWFILVDGVLSGPAFDQIQQTRTFAAFNRAEKEVTGKFSNVDILKTGAVFYSREAFNQAEKEATLIGGISLLGIVFLNFLIFRSLKPLLLSLLAIGSGIVGGLAIALLFFGKLHLLAIVFGAGLIGIAVDYSFHYFCERFQKDTPSGQQRISAIKSGLTLGLVSSVLGFLTLSLTPFPGLQQIALFSASGLTMAYLAVLYIFPLLDRSSRGLPGERILQVSMWMHYFWTNKDWRKARIVAFMVLLLVGVLGIVRFQIDDDVRHLQSLPQELQKEEGEIRSLAGIEDEAYHFYVRGTTSEDVLQLEERLQADLDRLVKSDKITGYRAVSRIIPSKARQNNNRELVSRNLFPKLGNHLDNIGLSDSETSVPFENNLDIDELTESDLPADIRLQKLVSTPGEVIHAITIIGVKEPAELLTLAATSRDVALVNQANDLTKTFGTYRFRALIMLFVAYCVVWVFLSLRYGLLGAVRVMFPSIGAVVLAPCVIALFGEAFTFFNAMSLILVFAIGLDYAIFNREAMAERKPRAMLANGLSAISTILAFGLLALSDTYAIHAFGVTILVGIVLAYCLAPLASDNNNKPLEAL